MFFLPWRQRPQKHGSAGALDQEEGTAGARLASSQLFRRGGGGDEIGVKDTRGVCACELLIGVHTGGKQHVKSHQTNPGSRFKFYDDERGSLLFA